ncbi:hypothetical protein [Owenweeksia hongkongensis]|nr:hypothetical protein [Owenweeksia hongkongensis]
MKSIIGAIFLTLILIFQFSGSQLLFHIQRSQIRREIKSQIKQGVPKEEMVRFRFSKSNPNIHWHNDHEFRFENHMYDVVHQESTTDSLFLMCITDDQETSLFAQLSKLTNSHWNQSPAKKQSQQAVSALSTFYLSTNAEFTLSHVSQAHLQGSSFYFFIEKCWASSPDSPPPQGLA